MYCAAALSIEGWHDSGFSAPRAAPRHPRGGRLHYCGGYNLLAGGGVRSGRDVQTQSGKNDVSQSGDVVALADGEQRVDMQRSEGREEVTGAEELDPCIHKQHTNDQE